MKFRDVALEAGLTLDYLLEEYPLKTTPVSRELPGISNVRELSFREDFQGGYRELHLWLPSCGGVSIDIKIGTTSIEKDSTGRLKNLRRIILEARPDTDALYWDFPYTINLE